MFVRVTVALIASVSVATVASAAPSAADRKVLRQYCSADYVTYCGDYDIGSPQVQTCFKKNRSKLSDPCRAAISGYLKKGKR